jgi:ADP-ribose pyrophosphatase YjhB (NUDIX family)
VTRPAHHSGLPPRPTVRILLADDRDRILLFRFVDADSDVPGRVWWTTPGGGVRVGETLPRAAARELFEETGLRVRETAFERVVARSAGAARYRGVSEWYEHHFYFIRLPAIGPDRSDSGSDSGAFELDASRWEDVERSTIAEHRWWTAAELAATTETVYPPGLPRVLPDLLAGRLPAEPFDVNRP